MQFVIVVYFLESKSEFC